MQAPPRAACSSDICVRAELWALYATRPCNVFGRWSWPMCGPSTNQTRNRRSRASHGRLEPCTSTTCRCVHAPCPDLRLHCFAFLDRYQLWAEHPLRPGETFLGMPSSQHRSPYAFGCCRKRQRCTLTRLRRCTHTAKSWPSSASTTAPPSRTSPAPTPHLNFSASRSPPHTLLCCTPLTDRRLLGLM